MLKACGEKLTKKTSSMIWTLDKNKGEQINKNNVKCKNKKKLKEEEHKRGEKTK